MVVFWGGGKKSGGGGHQENMPIAKTSKRKKNNGLSIKRERMKGFASLAWTLREKKKENYKKN